MIKSRYDSRTWVEIVGDLVSERTSRGDLIKLTVQYNGTKKPTVNLEFTTYDPDKKAYKPKEEITDWIDEKPYYDVIDDSTGQPLEGETRKGSTSWDEYVNVRFGPLVKSIVEAGGRIFSFEVIS